jgi:hypothetical protein
MLFSSLDACFSFAVILLLAASFIAKGKNKYYWQNAIAVSNTLLIFYSCYLLKSFIDLFRLALSLNVKPDNNLPPPALTWHEYRYILMFLLPFSCFFQKIAKRILLSICMLILFQWDWVLYFYQKIFTKQYTLAPLFYLPYNFEFMLLHFIVLFIGTYALLWLLKKLPSQQASR